MAAAIKTKKRIIAILLLCSCIACIILLMYIPPENRHVLQNVDQADSLILEELSMFNIRSSQINTATIPLDGKRSRKKLVIPVNPRFSKTHLHAELNRTLDDYGISTPAKVILPYEDMMIHLYYKRSVIRTIHLKTDPDVKLGHSPASILVSFDHRPSEGLLDKVISFGEPISIVLKVNDPLEAKTLQKDLSERYPYISFWLTDKNGESLLQERYNRSALPTLQHLQEVNPKASVISFKNKPADAEDPFYNAVKRSNLSFIDASNAVLLNAGMGKENFMLKLEHFKQRAREGEHPVAIITASDESLTWLQTKLSSFKKGGLYLTLPSKFN